jgi:hypothetical protein
MARPAERILWSSIGCIENPGRWDLEHKDQIGKVTMPPL